MPCGTVVDRDITGAGTFEWYMQPHHALQGSGRVSHYHVLVNDARLSPDELQVQAEGKVQAQVQAEGKVQAQVKAGVQARVQAGVQANGTVER